MNVISTKLTEAEHQQLLKAVQFNRRLPVYSLLCLTLNWVVIAACKDSQVLLLALSGTLILIQLVLLLRYALFSRCPRCRAWGTPVTGGHCSSCGMHLDHQRKP